MAAFRLRGRRVGTSVPAVIQSASTRAECRTVGVCVARLSRHAFQRWEIVPIVQTARDASGILIAAIRCRRGPTRIAEWLFLSLSIIVLTPRACVIITSRRWQRELINSL